MKKIHNLALEASVKITLLFTMAFLCLIIYGMLGPQFACDYELAPPPEPPSLEHGSIITLEVD